MRVSKLGAVALAVVLVTGTAGAGAYAVTAAATPKTVAVCANKANGGYLRMLEPKALARSAYGKCRTGEVKVPLSTTVAAGAAGAPGRGFDSAPFKLTFTGTGLWSCSWKADTATLACVTPTP